MAGHLSFTRKFFFFLTFLVIYLVSRVWQCQIFPPPAYPLSIHPASESTQMSHPYRASGCVVGASSRKTYGAPRFFPILPFNMVLGPQDNPCAFIPRNMCTQFSEGLLEWPESFVIEGIIAALGECPLRQCYVADFGANMGYVNSYAAALGAKVVGIEPQADLNEANAATIQHNCWQHRVNIMNGLVTLDQSKDDEEVSVSNLWRPTSTGGSAGDFKKERRTRKIFIGRVLAWLGSTTIDLVKIDVDSIDHEILGWLIDAMETKKAVIRNILIESRCHSEYYFRLQKLGFDVYQMDHHLRARFFDARGRDVYKYRGGPIPSLEAVGEEHLCRRGMRMLVKVPHAENVTMFSSHCRALEAMPFRMNKTTMTSWFLTMDKLRTPSVMENWSKRLVPSTQGVYKNEHKGMPGEVINPPPQCSIAL